jgi:hypothetical protein
LPGWELFLGTKENCTGITMKRMLQAVLGLLGDVRSATEDVSSDE